MSEAYRKSGVDIDAGNLFVEKIRPYVRKTRRSGVLADIGGYGGFFQIPQGFKEPVLVSGTDGVGTKLKLAIDLGRYDTIGIDLVAMCVNDIACSGAAPLFFLDYFATGKLDPEGHSDIIKGIADACRTVGCALIGGETAEMPDCYHGKDFDLAGFAVGIVERSRIVDGSRIAAGDHIIGIDSTGFHSNGYSLVRRILREQRWDLASPLRGMDRPLGEMLLTPTALYSPLILDLLKSVDLGGIAHITGGGFWDNIPRVLPATARAAIRLGSWKIPPLMRAFQEAGGIDDAQMLRVFNCGIGLILIVDSKVSRKTLDTIAAAGWTGRIVGEIEARKEGEPSLTIA